MKTYRVELETNDASRPNMTCLVPAESEDEAIGKADQAIATTMVIATSAGSKNSAAKCS
jgi:hypothetical protein